MSKHRPQKPSCRTHQEVRAETDLYDQAAQTARETCEAEGVVLMVFEGSMGNGLSLNLTPEMLLKAPTVLRQIADQIEQQTPPETTNN
jgi:hypothetical protein